MELCSALAVGGLTPYTALLKQIRQESDIPIRCLMRPRGGDFLYTPEEMELLCLQTEELKAAGASGFVIGCLDADGRLNKTAMKPLIQACGGLGITLHRAIDVSADPEQTYLDAMELGIDTVLTSGAAPSCLSGKNTIRSLLQLREKWNGPEILIGAGVNASVIEFFLREIPLACAFHMSGKEEIESGMRFRREGVPMGIPGLDEWHIQQTSIAAVTSAHNALNI